MGEAKRKKEINMGATMEFTDFTSYPEKIEALIDAGQVEALIVLHKIKTPVAGVSRLGMINAGMTKEEMFNTICVMRRTTMSMLGLTDETSPDPAPDTPTHAYCHCCDMVRAFERSKETTIEFEEKGRMLGSTLSCEACGITLLTVYRDAPPEDAN